MKKQILLIPFLFCLVLSLMLTSCNREVVEDPIIQEQTFDHTELAKKMYSPEFLEGKGQVVDGNLTLNVNVMSALTAEERAFINKEGALRIKSSFNIPYEDAIRIWGEDAPIPSEGISFAAGQYEDNDAYRGCTVCVYCGCGIWICTEYDICIIIIELD